MGLVEIATGKVLSSFSVFLFLTILLLVVARRISTSVLLFSVQSAIIAAEVFATGFRERLAEAYVVGALILAIKVVAIPRAFFGFVPEDALAASVALILTGAFLMVSRNKALMQMLGLLVLENGIFLAALTTTFGMPLVIEIGVFFDVLIGLLLMGIFAFRIRDTFDHLDVSKLRRLRG